MQRLFLLGGIISLMSSSAMAQTDVNPERLIMKCRTSAVSEAEQISCLEESLRKALPAVSQPDWANDGEIPASRSSSNFSSPVRVTNSAQPTGIGAEQVRMNESSLSSNVQNAVERAEGVVADFAYNQNDKLIIVLSNGQVWKQLTSDVNSVFLKSGDAPSVVVRKGAVSGYRMSFPDLNQTIIVTRIQ